MRIVVFSENKIFHLAVFGNNRQRIQFVIPDNIVRFFQRNAFLRRYEAIERRHEILHFRGGIHTAHAVIAAGDNPHQFSFRRTVVGNRHGGMSRFFFQRNDVGKSIFGRNVGIAGNETRFIILRAGNHCRLVSHRLRTVNKRYAAFRRQRDRHFIARNGLHDRGDHRYIHRNFRLFAFFEFYKRRFQRNVCGNRFRRRITGDQKVFVKGMRRFVDVLRHDILFLL